MHSITKLIAAATVSGVALVAATAAQAGSFSLRSGLSAEGNGLSFAGAASGGIGMGSMAFNPATITMFPGRNTQTNFNYILPQAEYDLYGTNISPFSPVPAFRNFNIGTGEIGGNGALVPASYSNYQVNDRLFIGVTTGAPFGLRSKPENFNYAGQIYGRSAKIATIAVSPTVGFKVTDWLSIGAALTGQYLRTELKQALTPAFNSTSTILEGHDTSFGYRLGATISPWANGTIGFGYRSSIRHTLEGSFISPVGAGGLIFTGDNPIKANLNLPDIATLSYSHQFTPELQVHLTGEWENWSRFRRIPLVAAFSGQPFSSLNFDYRDGWFFSIGAEYAWNPRLTLRAGVGYEISPVTDRNRNVFISDNNRLWLSAGLGYQILDWVRLDVSYAHLFVEDAQINIGPGHPQFPGGNGRLPVTFVGQAEPSVDILSASLTFRWDTPVRAAVPVEPIVRKY